MTLTQGSLSIAQALHMGVESLQASDTAKLDAEVLLAFCLDCQRSYFYTWPERLLTLAQAEQYGSLLLQRAKGVPIAHLIGEREFWSLPLQVNHSTLIPRPDTEVLVEQTLALDLPECSRVLDLGTGTGAIALALKHSRPHWQVVAVDKVSAAIALARQNAQALELAIDCVQSDWFSALSKEQKFNVIISNPPYIDAQDEHLEQGDLRYEPRSALVAGANGLADIQAIASQAGEFLTTAGWLLLEHGCAQGAAVRELLQQAGFTQVTTVRDYANLERVTLGQWRAEHG